MKSIAQNQSFTRPIATIGSLYLPNGLHGDLAAEKKKTEKSLFRFSFRKVAKTVKINLIRYWGLLNKLSIVKKETTDMSNSYMSAAAVTFTEEMEQNRINELLEADISPTEQNSLNTQHELLAMEILSFRSTSIFSSFDLTPPTRRFVRQRCCLSQESENGNCCKDSLYSSSSSISSSIYFQENDFQDDVLVEVMGDNNVNEFLFRA